jgi:hypothetical protein
VCERFGFERLEVGLKGRLRGCRARRRQQQNYERKNALH